MDGNFPQDYFKYDASNLKKFLDGFTEDIKKGYNQNLRAMLEGIKKNPGMRIIHCGMGGSAIAAEVMKSYLYDEDFVIENISDYKIPGNLKNTDLVVISSYSGNTEEALSCYKQVRRVGAQLIIITSGGKLEDSATSGRVPFVKLQKGYPPRSALPLMFFSLLRVLEDIGLISQRTAAVQDLVDKFMRQNLTDFAVDLSEKLYGKVPLIYASNQFYSVAYRWKTQINENAKSVAFSNKFPELNHNEINSFETKNATFHLILITTDSDNSRIRKRMQISKEIMQKSGVDVTELHVKGELLTKIFTAIYAGDLTSYYLALRYHTDPLPVKTVEEFKKKMGPFI